MCECFIETYFLLKWWNPRKSRVFTDAFMAICNYFCLFNTSTPSFISRVSCLHFVKRSLVKITYLSSYRCPRYTNRWPDADLKWKSIEFPCQSAVCEQKISCTCSKLCKVMGDCNFSKVTRPTKESRIRTNMVRLWRSREWVSFQVHWPFTHEWLLMCWSLAHISDLQVHVAIFCFLLVSCVTFWQPLNQSFSAFLLPLFI